VLLIPNRKYYSNEDEKFVIICFEINYRYKYLNRKDHLLQKGDKVLYAGLEAEFYIYLSQRTNYRKRESEGIENGYNMIGA
jgi:hypothetical protein